MTESQNPSEDQQLSDGLDALKAELANQTERADRNEARLRQHLLESTLERVATRRGAFNAAQVVTILKQHSEVVQAKDKNGKPLDGEYEVIVKGRDGKSLTPKQAVEGLRTSDPYIFFTQSDIRGEGDAKEGETDFQRMARLAKTNPDEYHRIRRESPEAFGLRPRPKTR